MKNELNLKNCALQKKAKELTLKSKKLGLIKSNTEAFKNNLVQEEEHKGKKRHFLSRRGV